MQLISVDNRVFNLDRMTDAIYYPAEGDLEPLLRIFWPFVAGREASYDELRGAAADAVWSYLLAQSADVFTAMRERSTTTSACAPRPGA